MLINLTIESIHMLRDLINGKKQVEYAAEHFVSPASVSARVKRIENDLSISLFETKGNAKVPTSMAYAMKPCLDDIVSGYERLRQVL